MRFISGRAMRNLPNTWLRDSNLRLRTARQLRHFLTEINFTVMNTMQQIKTWSATHHPRWLVFVRIALGLFLFAKGITFMHDTQSLERVIYGGQSLQENTTHYLPILICWANLLTGFFLMVGMMTRLVALIQIPILIGAII